MYAVLPFSKRISEYHEDQSPSNPRRTDNDMHDDRRKDERSVGIVCVEVIVQGPLLFLYAVSDDT